MLSTALWTLLVVTSVLVIGLVLLHRGRGSGFTDMFGGGISAGVSSTGSGERNLNRITWGVVIVFGMVIVLLGLMSKYTT